MATMISPGRGKICNRKDRLKASSLREKSVLNRPFPQILHQKAPISERIIGAFFLVHVFKRLKHKIDPRSYAGATFLGLRGFAVKTHGNSDALAFANSIRYTADLTKANLNGLIEERARALAQIRAEIKAEE